MMASIPAFAPLGEQLQLVLRFLKSPTNRRVCGLVEIAIGTGIPMFGNAALLQTLQQNPKVEVDARSQTARYVSSIVLDDVVDMLNLIAKSPRGLSASELEDAYPNSANDLSKLVRDGKCIRIYSLDRQSGDRIFPRLGADPFEGVGMAARGAVDHRLVTPVATAAQAKPGSRTLAIPSGGAIGDELARGELVFVEGKPHRVSLEAVQVSREIKRAAERKLLSGAAQSGRPVLARGMVADPAHSARELERGRAKDQSSLSVRETGGHFGATATSKHLLHQSWMYAHPHGGASGTITLDAPYETVSDHEREEFHAAMKKIWGDAHEPGKASHGGARRVGQKRPHPDAGASHASAQGGRSGSGSSSADAVSDEVHLYRLGCSLDLRALWRQVQAKSDKLLGFAYPIDAVGLQMQLDRAGVPRSLSLNEKVVKQRVAKMRRRGGGGSRGSIYDRTETRHLRGTEVGEALEKARQAVALQKQMEEEARWEEMQRAEEEEEGTGGVGGSGRGRGGR